MKKLFTIVAIATLTLGLGAISFAQDAGPQGGSLQGKRRPGPAAQVRIMEMFQKDVLAALPLTDDQKKKIDDLNSDMESKIKTIVTQNKGTTGNKNIGSQRKQVMLDYNNSMRDILGPDLWKQYRDGMLTKMKEAREKRQERQQAQQQSQTGKQDEMGGSGGG